MTAKELHETKIIPLRQELRELEDEYFELYHKECAEQAGLDKANCSNCACSCIIDTEGYHNSCLNDKCICCNDFCYGWIPETKVSAWLREHHHYNSEMAHRLDDIFDCNFIKSNNIDLIFQAIQLMEEIKKEVK